MAPKQDPFPLLKQACHGLENPGFGPIRICIDRHPTLEGSQVWPHAAGVCLGGATTPMSPCAHQGLGGGGAGPEGPPGPLPLGGGGGEEPEGRHRCVGPIGKLVDDDVAATGGLREVLGGGDRDPARVDCVRSCVHRLVSRNIHVQTKVVCNKNLHDVDPIETLWGGGGESGVGRLAVW